MRLTRVRWFLTLALLAVLCHAVHAQDDAAWTVDSEHWYVIEIGGQRAGWQSVIVETDGERWRTRQASRLSMSRGAEQAEVATAATILETDDGVPVSMQSDQSMSKDDTVSRWTFDPEARTVQQVVRNGSRVFEKTLPWPEGDWKTPRTANIDWLRQRDSGATIITHRVLTPENNLDPAVVTYTRRGEDVARYNGRDIPVTVWAVESSMAPGVQTTDQYDGDGHLIHSELDMAFGRIVTRIAPKAEAMRDGGPGPELMLQTFAPASQPIPNFMRARRATLRLTTTDGDDLDLPEAGAQRIEEQNGASVTIVVDADDPLPATDEERSDAAYLEASSLIDAEDELIRKLTESVLRRAGGDPKNRAEELRARVYRHVSRKGLATAFASASETARTRTGDCSEHAVLLAAMLRAAEIPSRIATGLLYIDRFQGQQHVFGWHMWTQALIDGKWIDLDATLPVNYHAGHVLTGVSALTDSTPASELNTIMSLIGNLEIEVVDVGH